MHFTSESNSDGDEKQQQIKNLKINNYLGKSSYQFSSCQNQVSSTALQGTTGISANGMQCDKWHHSTSPDVKDGIFLNSAASQNAAD
jgi:hypothetical protein